METEATHIFVVNRSFKGALSIQDMFRSIINDLLLMVLKFEKFIFIWAINFNFLGNFLLSEVPDYRKLK